MIISLVKDRKFKHARMCFAHFWLRNLQLARSALLVVVVAAAGAGGVYQYSARRRFERPAVHLPPTGIDAT